MKRLRVMGWRAFGLLLATAAPFSGACAEMVTPKPVVPGPPGPSSPTATQPPEIKAKPPADGVIKPPGDISRMPVIKPSVPSRMPVIPPSGGSQTPGAIKVVPK